MTTNVDSAITALADPTRRAVFELVAEGPRSVGAIAGQLPVSRPAVSQHLKVLKVAGLVTDRAEGAQRIYQMNPEGVEVLRRYFDRFWTDALGAFKRRVESNAGSGKRPPRQEEP